MENMFGLGPHAGYIIASYLVTAIAVLIVLGYTMFDHRRLKREVALLEQRGIMRVRKDMP